MLESSQSLGYFSTQKACQTNRQICENTPNMVTLPLAQLWMTKHKNT
jgi:hypothetical protein